MASSQLRRAETREYGEDPSVGILFSLSWMLSLFPPRDDPVISCLISIRSSLAVRPMSRMVRRPASGPR